MIIEGITNNQYSKLAKKIVKEHFPNLMGEDAYRQFYNIVNKCVNRTVYLEQCTNNIASNYFLPGCVRLFIEDPSYSLNKMEEILEFLTKNPNKNLDYNFNGVKTVDELYTSVLGKNKNTFSVFNSSLQNRVSEKDDGKFVKVGNYTIYNCFTYDTIEKFVKLEDKQNSICYVGNIKSFYKDEGRFAKNAKYACLRDDYRELNTFDINKNYPYDDYGLSLIIITVGVNGELIEVCSRWNNGAKIISPDGTLFKLGNILKEKGELSYVLNKKKNLNNMNLASNYLTKKQIESIILNNEHSFEEIFKPFTESTYNSRLSNEPKLKKWIDDVMQYKAGKERDNFFSTTKNNINAMYNVHEGKTNKLNILWLDDRREPYYYLYKKKSDSRAFLRNKAFYDNLLSKYDAKFTWVKNIDEFKKFILTNGVPDFVSFDRDLGTAPITGMDCAKWLVGYCKENGVKFPKYFVHSANVDNGQVAINNMLKDSVAENVVKLSKEDLTEMVKSVICALTEDAYINNLNTKNKTASITYQKGNSAYKRKVSNDYLDTSMMDKLDKDTYEVPLKGGITSYNITSINGTKVMHYFKNYFDRKKTIETITNRSTGKKEDYNLKMEKNEFESFKSMFIKKVDKVIQYCINNFDNKDFAKVSIYPVPSSSKFNVEMANEMAGVNFANITGGTQVINTEMFRKNLKNLEVDKDFIEKNKDYYNSPLYADNPTGETHMNSVNTTANKYKTLSSYIDIYVKYINRLVDRITTMVNADRSNMKKKNSQAQYSNTLGKRLVKFYWQLANAYEEIIEYSAYIDDFTGKEKIQYTDDQLKPLKYAKTAVNIANTDLVYELVKPYVRGLKTRNGKPIKKLPIMPVENRFSIKSMTNDIRLGLKNYFLADDEIVKQELEKIQNTVFVIFDDNISGGATLSDICLQAKNLGIQYIIPITFGKMRESYSKHGGSSITKPDNLNFS